MTPKEIISSIRRDEFLLDSKLSPELEVGASNLRSNLHNAVHYLSEELYSTETHFVLELMQNADDNSYDEGSVPSVSFQLQPDRLVITNNEVGFTEDNVRALCSVGKSTKKLKLGFIGEKGIGFKSVFKVTDTPEIHSRGFHFRFDNSSEKNLLGYIVPIWCPPTLATDDSLTHIVLPAKKNHHFDKSLLAELHPKVLLFLRRLQHIEVQRDGLVQTFHRADESSEVLLTVSEETTISKTVRTISNDRYVCKRHLVTVDEVTEEKRKDAHESEIVLAFCVDASGRALPEQNCQTFAFLPIGSFGFTFCIQADFILSSSREAILADRPWNVLLRDTIAEVFAKAIEASRDNPPLSNTILRFIPAEASVISAFFRPVVAQLLAMLSKTACIRGATGTWRRPSEILLASSAFRALVSPDEYFKLFGKEYPHPEVDAGDGMLGRLGCNSLTYGDLASIFEDHGSWVAKKGKAWLASFYAYLASLSLEQLEKTVLPESSWALTHSGELACPRTTAVFFPLARDKEYGFETELVLLDADVLRVAVEQTPAAQDLFQRLGVKVPKVYERVTDHILPRHSGDSWKHSSQEALVGHLRYIKDHLDEFFAEAAARGISEAAALERLRNGLWLGTKGLVDGKWLFAKPAQTYLGKEYGADFCIETLIADSVDPNVLVSDCYLVGSKGRMAAEVLDPNREEWRHFMFRLGVNSTPRVLQDSPSSDPRCSPELEALIQSRDVSVRRATLECFDRNWSKYASYVQMQIAYGRNTTVSKDSTFITALRSMLAPTKAKSAVKLSQCFYPTDEVVEVFGSSPVYVDAKLSDSALFDACHIVHRVDAEACIKRLQQLKASAKPGAKHVYGIYRQLERIFPRNATRVRSAFQVEPLILVKGHGSEWFRLQDVSWDSPGGVLGSLFPTLRSAYRDFHGFFVRMLGVPVEFPISRYVEALPELSKHCTADDLPTEALRIYDRMNRWLEANEFDPNTSNPAWLQTLRMSAVFLDHHGRMVRNSETLLADDLPRISVHFRNVPGLSFLAVPASRLSHLGELLGLVPIANVSERVQLCPLYEGGGAMNERWTKVLRSRLELIARFISHRYAGVFRRALEAGAFRDLCNIEVLDVTDLQIEATLVGRKERIPGEVGAVDGRILLGHGVRGISDLLAEELCKRLNAPAVLADGLSRILMSESVADVEDYLGRKDVPPLSDDFKRGLFEAGVRAPVEAGVREAGEGVEYESDESPDQTVAPAHAPTGAPTSQGMQTSRQGAAAHGGTLAPVSATRLDVAAPSRPAVPAGHETSSDKAGQTHPSSPTRTDEVQGPAEAGPALPASKTPSTQARQETLHGGISGSPRSRPRERRKRHRPSPRTGRLLSYAGAPDMEVKEELEPADEAAQQHRDEVSRAAVEVFLQSELAKRWTKLDVMPPSNKGFDIRGTASDGIHYVEVKGCGSAWTEAGIALTPAELRWAEEHRGHYWLCVVEYATLPERRTLHLVQDPFGRTNEFRYDSGWKGAAEVEAAHVLRPEPGVRINMGEEGIGTIVSVKRTGQQFCRIHVRLDNGQQIHRTFNPAKMRLIAA